MRSQYLQSISTANNDQQIKRFKSVQFEFELEIHETFHTILVRFCSRFLTTVKMTHRVEIGKFNSFSGQNSTQTNLCGCCNCLG